MSRSRLLTVLLAALLLIGGSNVVSYAVSGGPLLLGRTSTAGGPTTLHNSGAGPVLRLRGRPGAPPLAVSSRVKVPRLNADRVDGVSAKELGLQVRRYLLGGDGDEDNVVKSFPGLPHAWYWVSYEFRATYVDGLSCWLDNGTGTRLLSTTGAVDEVLTAEGVVDARHGVAMRCEAGGIFDSGATTSSHIDFVRLSRYQVGKATTTALPGRRDDTSSPGRHLSREAPRR